MSKRLTCHDAYIRTVPLPGWDYLQPVCTCGWCGLLHRGRYWANDEIDEHLTNVAPNPGEQPALPGFDTPFFEESSCSADA